MHAAAASAATVKTHLCDHSLTHIHTTTTTVMAKHADVTRRAAQLLLAYRGLLTPQQLARLAAKMGEVGMQRELRELVESSVTAGSHQGQAVGFVAAALTGGPPPLCTLNPQTCLTGARSDTRAASAGALHSPSRTRPGPLSCPRVHVVAGDLELLQRALQASSTDALAALQANTYRLPSALATEGTWNRALRTIGATLGAHPTGSYAYFSVTTQAGL